MSATIGDLQGKTALITGSTKGVGAAVARRFVDAGARVVISGRNGERGTHMEGTIRERGGDALFVSIDLSVEEHAVYAQVGAVLSATNK
jgi:NAD(P)-dependent dehydrogenase (short-subunit alcohol dehydrogenase family)